MKTEIIINRIAYLVLGFIIYCLAMIVIEVGKNTDRITFGHF
jgi:hypothetical protein